MPRIGFVGTLKHSSAHKQFLSRGGPVLIVAVDLAGYDKFGRASVEPLSSGVCERILGTGTTLVCADTPRAALAKARRSVDASVVLVLPQDQADSPELPKAVAALEKSGKQVRVAHLERNSKAFALDLHPGAVVEAANLKHPFQQRQLPRRRVPSSMRVRSPAGPMPRPGTSTRTPAAPPVPTPAASVPAAAAPPAAAPDEG